MDTRACCGCSPGIASSRRRPADLFRSRAAPSRAVSEAPRRRLGTSRKTPSRVLSIRRHDQSSDPGSRRRVRSEPAARGRAARRPRCARAARAPVRAAGSAGRLEAEAAAGMRARGPRAGGPGRAAGGDPGVAPRARTVPRVRRSLRVKPGAARPRSHARRKSTRYSAVPSRSTRRSTGAPAHARPPVTRADRDARGPPRHGHRSRAATARARTAHECPTSPALAHGERARRARDGSERAEPHAARVHAPGLAARRVAGGPPRAPQARGRPRTALDDHAAAHGCQIRDRVDVVRRSRPARSRRCSTAVPSTAGSAGCRGPLRCRSRCPRPRCTRARRWRRS